MTHAEVLRISDISWGAAIAVHGGVERSCLGVEESILRSKGLLLFGSGGLYSDRYSVLEVLDFGELLHWLVSGSPLLLGVVLSFEAFHRGLEILIGLVLIPLGYRGLLVLGGILPVVRVVVKALRTGDGLLVKVRRLKSMLREDMMRGGVQHISALVNYLSAIPPSEVCLLRHHTALPLVQLMVRDSRVARILGLELSEGVRGRYKALLLVYAVLLLLLPHRILIEVPVSGRLLDEFVTVVIAIAREVLTVLLEISVPTQEHVLYLVADMVDVTGRAAELAPVHVVSLVRHPQVRHASESPLLEVADLALELVATSLLLIDIAKLVDNVFRRYLQVLTPIERIIE